MIKEVEHHQHLQQTYPIQMPYPTQMPSAPPSYDEAMYHQTAPQPTYMAPPPPGNIIFFVTDYRFHPSKIN